MESDLLKLAGGAFALITTTIGVLRFVASQVEALRKETFERIKEAVGEEAHDRKNALQPLSSQLERTAANLRELEREAVRRSDLAPLEARLTRMEATLDKLSGQVGAGLEAIVRRIEGGR